ncbi:Tripartite DNA replication factor [Actinomortierella ambigua]|nr:Tripartite DNA replication factor [Actinomortierella ambigua]
MGIPQRISMSEMPEAMGAAFWPQTSRPTPSDLRPSSALNQENKREFKSNNPIVVSLSPGPLPISNTPSPEPEAVPQPTVINVDESASEEEDVKARSSLKAKASSVPAECQPASVPASSLSSAEQKTWSSASTIKKPSTPRKEREQLVETFNERSPDDSIYWARTPPTEALKRVNRRVTLQSRDDEVASILARLDSKSIGGQQAIAPRRSKMLEVLERLGQNKEEPSSSTSSTASRHEGPSSLSRRRRRLLGDKTPTIPSPLSPNRIPQDQVRRMVAQLSSGSSYSEDPHDTEDSGTDSTGRPRTRRGRALDVRMNTIEVGSGSGSNTAGRVSTSQMTQAPGVNTKSSPLKTPTRAAQIADSISGHPPVVSSPGEYDQLLDDMEMDEEMLEALTQYELELAAPSSSATTLTSSSSATSTISSAGSSTVSSCPRSSSNGSTTSIQGSVSHLQLHTSRKGSSGGILAPEGTALPPKTPGPLKVADDDFDEFGDLGDDFDFEEEDLTTPTRQKDKYLRFRVVGVDDSPSSAANPALGRCKILVAQEQGNTTDHTVHLYGLWADTCVSSGDTIHVVDSKVVSAGVYHITNEQGYIIVRPDNLVSTSVLSESFTCLRKSVLNTRVTGSYDLTVPLVHGNILHELFQACLCAGNFSTSFIQEKIGELAREFVRDLALIGETVDTAKAALEEMRLPMQAWANRYVRPTPAKDGTVQDSNTQFSSGSGGQTLCINKVLDVEENIWSPMFGLKGKIDASVQVRVMGNQGEMQTLTVPFELKTGRSSHVMAHRAQTILYTLLMTDRYGVDVKYGLLFYLKTGDFIRVPAVRDEVRAIMMQRNEMALYDDTRVDLPPMIKRERTCRYCFSISTCTVMHKLTEHGTAVTAGMGDDHAVFDDKTSHLSEVHAEFYKKWDEMLTLEQGGMFRFRSLIWSVLAQERQTQGQCFSKMVLLDPEERERRGSMLPSMENKFGRHRYRFGTSLSSHPLQDLSQPHLSQQRPSLLHSSITVGDPIVVSSENGHYALAVGFVLELSLNEVVVGLDRPLLGPPMPLDGFDTTRNQVYRGLMEISEESQTQLAAANDYYMHVERNKVTFRIDRDEMSAGLARIRNNIVTLFRSNEDDGDWKRRGLIVDLEPPKFSSDAKVSHVIGAEDAAQLNSDQIHAVEKVMAAQDYALILGMPGTGKTTTITQIIKTLVAQGKSVLLTSYTHSAVDNVLLKLRGAVDFVRLGNVERVDHGIREFVPDFSRPPLNTIEAINRFYDSCQVVGTTCLGIGDPMFAKKRFDYCIVDEASQITLPVCLGPIRLANVFVLVGDHHQLSPLVKNPEAKSKGFDVSLFKLLSDKYPEAVASLTHQYRMNEDIMHLSNSLIYADKLQCATEAVAKSRLTIPHLERGLTQCHLTTVASKSPTQGPVDSRHRCPRSHDRGQQQQTKGACWLATVLDPSRSVVFVDTDAIPAREVRFGELVQNPIEAQLVVELTEALIRGGIAEQDIGIISVYRAQLKVLSRLFKTSRRGTASQQQRSHRNMDIQTVDRYQGTDKDCVIISLVRSNVDQAVGELLKDWRRINVAFTRAKKKLVVFGSRSTLQGSPIFEKFLKVMEEQEWVLTLPAMAQEHHPGLLTVQQSAIAAQSFHHTASRLELIDEDEGEDDTLVNANHNQENRPPLPLPPPPQALLGKRPQQGEGRDAETTRRAKVFHASAEVVTKRHPVVRHLLDDLP